jgi:hypothetical protein
MFSMLSIQNHGSFTKKRACPFQIHESIKSSGQRMKRAPSSQKHSCHAPIPIQVKNEKIGRTPFGAQPFVLDRKYRDKSKWDIQRKEMQTPTRVKVKLKIQSLKKSRMRNTQPSTQ